MTVESRNFAATIPISSIIFRWDGIFDFDGLYSFIQSWIANREYEFHEKSYKQKPEIDKIGEHIELKWYGERKVTEYVMNRIDMHMHAWNVEKVELDGKILTKARLWIQINSTLILDWQEKWGRNSFFRYLRDFFNEYIVKKDIDLKWGEDLRLETNKFLEDIKAYMNSMARGKVY